MRKRGQFYLLSAIIIIAIIIGFSTISTYVNKGEVVRILDLGDELEIESANVLDYGTYSTNVGSANFDAFVEGFVDKYADYIGEDKEISFVFGSSEGVSAINYEYDEDTDSTITIGESRMVIKERKKDKKTIGRDEVELGNSKATINFKGVEYEIELKPGENFYFVISQDIGEERYSTKSEEIKDKE